MADAFNVTWYFVDPKLFIRVTITGIICAFNCWENLPKDSGGHSDVTKWPCTLLRQVVLSLVACCADDGRQGPSHALTVGVFSRLSVDVFLTGQGYWT